MPLLIFFGILSLLVLVHELGHFLLAKKNGIDVPEFGFGLPPRLFGKKFGDTLYSFNLLPFGGFVSLKGEDSQEYEGSLDAAYKDPKNFMSKKPSQKLQVLLAGVFMNVLLAFLIYYVLFMFNGFKSYYFPLPFDYTFKFGNQHNISTVVADVMPDSAAFTSGIKVGEAVVSINDTPINSADDIKSLLRNTGSPVTVKLRDVVGEGTERIVSVAPLYDSTAGGPVLGVLLTSATYLSYDTPVQKVLAGPMHSFNILDYSSFALKELISTSIETKSTEPVSSSVAGPVGIYSIVKAILDSTSGKKAVLSILDYTAVMSLSLAFINVMPFPALDGGRAVFVIIEAVTKKRIHPKFESFVHRAGMALLLSLLVLVSIKDILRGI